MLCCCYLPLHPLPVGQQCSQVDRLTNTDFCYSTLGALQGALYYVVLLFWQMQAALTHTEAVLPVMLAACIYPNSWPCFAERSKHRHVQCCAAAADNVTYA